MRAFIVLSAILAVSLAASIKPENDVEAEDVGEVDDVEEADDVVAGPTARKLKFGKVKHNDRDAELISYRSQTEDKGYSYSYAIDDGQEREEEGHLVDTGDKVLTPEVKGHYQWTDPKTGKSIKVEYIANKYGYNASGDSIPTPVPNPPWVDALLRVLATANPEIEDEVDAKPPSNKIGIRPKTKTPVVDKNTVVRKVVVPEKPKPVEEDNKLKEEENDDDVSDDEYDDEAYDDDEE